MEIDTKENVETSKIKGYHYLGEIIQKGIQYFINCNVTLRGIEKIFKLSNSQSKATPGFSNIRKWIFRSGLYELQRQKEYRKDWIFIIDFTRQLGQNKALLILGIHQEHLLTEVIPSNRGLSHQDVEVLALEVMRSTKGELIKEKLDILTKKVGKPIQIVADYGSDIASGIKLYQQDNPEVVYTHDVTHGMALILKHKLEKSERYQCFVRDCHQCRNQLQQTELHFLAPPTQRSQCRYFNVEILMKWAIKMSNSSLDNIAKLVPNIPQELLEKKVVDKLEWLDSYQSDIKYWNQIVKMTRTLETQLKLEGINHQSLNIFEQKLEWLTDISTQDFQNELREYLINESSKIPQGQTFLATSDVIESIFGKYKEFAARSPLKHLGQLLLTIPLCTMKLTIEIVQKALSTVRFVDVEKWSEQVFGQSALSKRRNFYAASSR